MKKIYLILTLLIGLLHGNFTFGQVYYPGGVSCNFAIPIAVGDNYATYDDGPGSDHWYRFIAPCDGVLNVEHFDAEIQASKRIYSGVCGSLFLHSDASWAVAYADHEMLAGESVYIQINDSFDGYALFNIAFTDCPELDPDIIDVAGTVYYDLNENGIKDVGEIVAYSNVIRSEPIGFFAMTEISGYYSNSVLMLDDGIYEIFPEVDEYWKISSDSLVYTLNVDGSFEFRDSLDFGLAPDTLIYEVASELVGGFPRCNDTIAYWLSWENVGTTIASGVIHLELDDSLSYVTADIVPDSIIGQNLYWHYSGLFFDEFDVFMVQVATPDGYADTVVSTLSISVDSSDVEMFVGIVELEQIILCAFDPNDKTPNPLGVGEFGYIAPDTETIEYLVRFQNTGTDTAINVVIEDQLDENLDWNSFELLSYSHDIELAMSVDGEISFIFNGIMLPDSNVNVIASQGFVKYKIDLLPGLPLETSIFNTAYIYFDLNPAVITNTTINTLYEVIDDASINELASQRQLLVYPNPFTETTTVYFGEDLINHSIQIVDITGKVVYSNTTLNGNKVEIDASSLTEGMYILLLIDNESNQVISNAKLMVK
jgi:hypothetical protein